MQRNLGKKAHDIKVLSSTKINTDLAYAQLKKGIDLDLTGKCLVEDKVKGPIDQPEGTYYVLTRFGEYFASLLVEDQFMPNLSYHIKVTCAQMNEEQKSYLAKLLNYTLQDLKKKEKYDLVTIKVKKGSSSTQYLFNYFIKFGFKQKSETDKEFSLDLKLSDYKSK